MAAREKADDSPSAFSRFAKRLLAARPETREELEQAAIGPWTRASMLAFLDAQDKREDDGLKTALRRLRQRVLLRVLARDLGGLVPAETEVHEPAPRDNVAPPKKHSDKAKSKRDKPRPRSAASSASSASSASRSASVARAAGAAASANYRSLVAAEINRRKFYPSAARDSGARGIVVVSFKIGRSGAVAGFRITRSSGNSALDGAVSQMMRSVSFPPPPGGSFSANVPIRFEMPR